MEEYDQYVLTLQILSIFSVTASCLTMWNSIFLYFYQRSNQSLSNHTISIAIIFICLGDALGNSPYLSQARPATGSPTCEVQGFFNMFGYSISWTWTLYISYVLYSMSTLEKMPENFKLHSALALFIPLLFAAVQFVFGFTRQDEEQYDVCIFSRDHEGGIIYHYVTYYGLLASCFVGMIYMRYQQYLLERNNDYRMNSQVFIASKTMLKHYPRILAICWIPRIIILPLLLIPSWLRLFTVCLKISHGFLIACIYFFHGEQCRKVFWKSFNPCIWLAIIKNDKDSLALLDSDGLFAEDFAMSMSMFKASDASRPSIA